jgi:hypothetical protein
MEITFHNTSKYQSWPMPKSSRKQPNKKKNPAAVALGRLGGLKGGPARAAKLTPEQRSEFARRAVIARWSKRK